MEVRKLRISRRTADKISELHDLDPADVRDAVEGRRVPFRWEDPQNPHKALVTTEIDGRPVLIVLFPAEDELGMVWNLGSAYHLDE